MDKNNPLARTIASLRHAQPLTRIALLLTLLLAMPLVTVALSVFQTGESGTWSHLASTVLPEYIGNTVWLCVLVGLGTAFGGVATGWLVAMHRFPGQRLFEWALVLPLAMPAYVMAYVYTDLLQFVGPVQTWLRDAFGWQHGDYWFPDVRSLGGAATMFVFVLYPYVYVLARTAFAERAAGMAETARSLGLGPWATFFRVSLPLARPALVAGVSLALMETLADFGTVSYFGVQTFTTGIYRAWFSLGDKVVAAQLSTLLLLFVVAVLTLERASRGGARFHDTTGRNRPAPGAQLTGWQAAAAFLLCLVPLLLGFAIPALTLARLAFADGDAQFGGRFLLLARNSFTLAAVTALCAVLLAVLLAYAARLARTAWGRALPRIVGLGYAVPGSVIAVGVLIPVIRLDHWIAAQWVAWTGNNPGLVLTGGIAALVYAYLVRFLAIALQSVETPLGKITRSMDEAARSLGEGQWAVLRRVHLPLLRGGMLSAALLVFVDVMKELPATLVMRPFNFDTLATRTYTLASDERLSEASTAALAIVVVGLVPLIVLSRQLSRARAAAE